MKRAIIAALLALTLAPFTGAGQEEPGALINRIKRDTAYLYGEATTAIRPEALVLAKELLCRNIEEWYKEQGREETRAIIASDIVTGCEEITLMRGTMHRAFAYVRKSDLKTTGDRITVLPKSEPKPQPAPATPAAEPEPKPAPQPEPQPEPKSAAASPAGEEAAPTTAPAAEAAEEEPAATTAKPAFPLDELCGQRSIQAVRTLLNRPACKTVSSYGSVTRETRPADVEQALLIIYSPVNGEVKAILDGKNAASKRRNLLTGREDSTRNYPGCQALWLLIDE